MRFRFAVCKIRSILILPTFLFLFAIVISPLSSQDGAITVAVLDLEGRGISQLEAQTLSDRLSTSISKTGVVRLVERNLMEEILTEQGFQQTGCTSDECAVEVGQLLGVQYMVSGAIGKIGDTYTIDAKLVSVETGVVKRTRDVTYVGKVDGLIIEIEILGYEIMDLQPTAELLEKRRLGAKGFLEQQASAVIKTRTGALIRSLAFPGLGHFYAEKKKWGYGWAASELVTLGLIFAAYSSYQSATDDYNTYTDLYNNETDTDLIVEYRDKAEKSHGDIESANGMIETMISVAAAVWIGNAVHTYLSWPKKGKPKDTASVGIGFNRDMQQVQLQLKIPLGD